MEPRGVILLGYRGSGKTTVGPKLADRLGLRFADTDDEVVRRFGGRPIKKIWEDVGEPAFREVEADVLEEQVAKPGVVVALGGGAVTQSAASRVAVRNSDALKVYLFAPAMVLAHRIRGDAGTANNRPSLTADGSADAEVAEVLSLRDPVYRKTADVVVDVSKASIEEIVEEIAAAYEAT